MMHLSEGSRERLHKGLPLWVVSPNQNKAVMVLLLSTAALLLKTSIQAKSLKKAQYRPEYAVGDRCRIQLPEFLGRPGQQHLHRHDAVRRFRHGHERPGG